MKTRFNYILIFAFFALSITQFGCKKSEDTTPTETTTAAKEGSVVIKIDGKTVNFDQTPSVSDRFNFYRKRDQFVNFQRNSTDLKSYFIVNFTQTLEKGGFPLTASGSPAIIYFDGVSNKKYVAYNADAVIKINDYSGFVLKATYTANMQEEAGTAKLTMSGEFNIKLTEI